MPPDHLAYWFSDIVDQLDLSPIAACYEQERRPALPSPDDGQGAALRPLSRGGVLTTYRRLGEDIAFRVMAGNNTPDFRTISDFRKDDPMELSELFLQVLAVSRRAGPVKLGQAVLDETEAEATHRRTGQ